MQWSSLSHLSSRSFKCGHCNEFIASIEGTTAKKTEKGSTDNNYAQIYICHYCMQPTYFDHDGKQYPGSTFGSEVKHITSNEVKDLYSESRECMKANAYTASAMCSRKLLMNIAVDKGADEGLKYIEYVDYLDEKGYTPPNSKDWVDSIRDKGNDANHEIKMMSEDDAKQLIRFTEMILKFIYEFPGSIKPETTEGNNET